MISYRKTPNGKLERVTDKMYLSWSDTHYSPVGEFLIDIDSKYLGTYENSSTTNWVYKAKILSVLDVDVECQIKCIMRLNKFENWELNISPMDSLPEIDRDSLGKMIWEKAFEQFNYDLTNIMPQSIGWKSSGVTAYKSERLNEKYIAEFGKVPQRYIKEINNALLALEYTTYLNYSLSRENAYKIISYPSLYRSYKNFIDNKNKPVDEKAYQNTRKAMSLIPDDIFIKNKGSRGGRITPLGMKIINDHLNFVRLASLENIETENLRNKSIKVGNK